jgi:double zinc ribbon protein
MHLSRRDDRLILSGPLPNESNRTPSWLVVGLITVIALFNPVFLGSSSGHVPTVIVQSGTTSTANAILTTTPLNLTQPNLNASRSFQMSSWSSNSTSARTIINSTDAQGETVSAVWHLDQSGMALAQTIKYNFEFATSVPIPGSSGPRITASLGLTSSNYNNWYDQNRTPVYPNNTKTISIVNIEGSYANGSSRRSLLLQAQQVTNASGGNSTTLFQQEFPRYAAGDGAFHRYSIEIDLQSNRTIWVVDDTIIAMFKLSFVPANMVLIGSANSSGNSAVATLKDPVQTALLPLVPTTSIASTADAATPVTFSILSGQVRITNFTSPLGQISSLQNQIDHLNGQVGNLTSQNAQLQARNSQWFSQWWFSIVWALLGGTVGAFLFVSSARIRTGRKDATSESGRIGSCPHCGGQMPLDATFCGDCGTTLRETRSKCPGCGQQMPPASLYCGDCGTQIPVRDRFSQNSAHTSTSESVDENQETWR